MRSRLDSWLAVAIVLLTLSLVAAARIGWAVYVFGDWTCALAQCVKVDRVND